MTPAAVRRRLAGAARGLAPVDAVPEDDVVREELGPSLGWRPGAPARLRVEHRRCLAKDLLADRAIARAGAAFDARGIRWALLKGAALRRIAYGGPGRRSMGDVDLLVDPARFEDACAALRGAGAVDRAPPGRAVTAARDYARALELDAVTIEVHRDLATRALFAPDVDGILARATDAIPAAEDLFLSLAIHAAKHAWDLPVRAIVDALVLSDAVGLDRDVVAGRARAWRARRATAVWLQILCAHGLDETWREVAGALDDGPVARELARRAPWRGGGAGRWARIALGADGVAAPLAWATRKATWRLGDLLGLRG